MAEILSRDAAQAGRGDMAVARKGKDIFVFGSNRAGIHGAGSAKEALERYGAQWGIGEGLAGNSYALPTKDSALNTLPLSEIQSHVVTFIKHAKDNPQNTYSVVRVGCGLAGYKDNEVAPLFALAGENIHLPSGWRDIIGGSK